MKKITIFIVILLILGGAVYFVFSKQTYYTEGAKKLHNILCEEKSDNYEVYISQSVNGTGFIISYETTYNWEEIFKIKSDIENFVKQNSSMFGDVDRIFLRISNRYERDACLYPYVEYYNDPRNMSKLDRMKINANISQFGDTVLDDVEYIWLEHGDTYDFTVELFEHFPNLKYLYIANYYVDNYEELEQALPDDCIIELI